MTQYSPESLSLARLCQPHSKDRISSDSMATKTLLARPFTLAASHSILQSPKPASFPIKLRFLRTVKSSRAAIVSVVCKIRTPDVRFPDGFGFSSDKLMQSMEKKIKEELNAEQVSVKDAYGDGRHVSIDVISSSFEGQSAVNRQRIGIQSHLGRATEHCACS